MRRSVRYRNETVHSQRRKTLKLGLRSPVSAGPRSARTARDLPSGCDVEPARSLSAHPFATATEPRSVDPVSGQTLDNN